MNNMDRRDFTKSLGVKAGALSAMAVAPAGFMASPLMKTAGRVEDKTAEAKPADPGLYSLCKAILKQNKLAAGERMVVATSYIYDQEYVNALLEAGSKLGAATSHMAVYPKFDGEKMVSGATRTHAEMFAEADLLIDCGMGRPPKMASPGVGSGKKLDHEFETDRQALTSPTSKTRWLSLGGGMSGTVELQRFLFPTYEIREISMRGAEIFHNGRELHVTCPHGTDIKFSIEGRVGHCQYGMADVAGRWDNFATGLSETSPVEESAEGKIVYVPGDDISNVVPTVLPNGEGMTLTYGGSGSTAGQATSIEGGRLAREFEAYLGQTNHPDITRMAHVGYGTDPRIHKLRYNMMKRHLTDGDFHTLQHNMWGGVMIAMGKNTQYHGGPYNNYSGLGLTADNNAPFHPHTGLTQGASLSIDGVLLVDKGDLTAAATGGALTRPGGLPKGL
jgi:2,5-dihydroxypyridine 5,6-dioxygenase